jgi:hypothetical protein
MLSGRAPVMTTLFVFDSRHEIFAFLQKDEKGLPSLEVEIIPSYVQWLTSAASD